jgi:hypothetical protein
VVVFAAALALAILLAVPLLVRSQRAALDG